MQNGLKKQEQTWQKFVFVQQRLGMCFELNSTNLRGSGENRVKRSRTSVLRKGSGGTSMKKNEEILGGERNAKQQIDPH